METMRLRRVCPGFYETTDRQWEIVQGEPGCSWARRWIARRATNRHVYSDPQPTLQAAREVLDEMIAAREVRS